MRKLISIAAAIGALLPVAAMAQSITPATYTDTINEGESGSFKVTVTTPDSGPATDLIDIVFLADNTGSMGGEIAAIQAQALALLSTLEASGADINYAVTSYFGDPSESSFYAAGNLGSNSSSASYNAITPFTGDITTVQAGINQWFASGGGDGPEAAIYALYQIATNGALSTGGVGSGIDLGFRSGASKIVVWFGDIGNHEDTVTVPEAIAALQAAGITVIAINSGGNLNSFGDSPNQATNIVNATGGIETTASSSELVDAILDSIDDVTTFIDLELVLSETFPGLPVTVMCVSAEGCDDVGVGESRMFMVSYDGLAVGTYTFEATVTGLSVKVDPITIHVVGGPEVPLPGAALLFLTGAGGLVARRKLRRA